MMFFDVLTHLIVFIFGALFGVRAAKEKER